MSFSRFPFVIYLFIFVRNAAGVERPIVETTHGNVSGKVLKTLMKEIKYYGYMGIPYAAQPVKDFRFLPPQPMDPWEGVLPATKEKQACIQYNNNIKKGQPLGHYGVEDCLYLDIFTPHTLTTTLYDNKRPVIVFLYNENFKYSYNKTKDYAPDFFIEDDIIVATITHRLSVFGFLSFEDDILPGNSGLKDIVVGLEWIRNNVERFGGDRNRITLMGSQGGAAAADLLIHSKARKLFNSVILQGGTSWTSLYLQDKARERAFKLGDLLLKGSSNSSRLLNELKDIPAEDLLLKELEAIPQDYNKETQRGLLPFGPIIEKLQDGLLKKLPEKSDSLDIPIMIGFNSREGLEKSLQYLLEPRYLSFVEKDFVLIMPRRANFKFDPFDATYYDAVSDIKNEYFPKGKVTIRNIPEYVTYMGDLMTEAVDYAAKFYSNISTTQVYYYYFDYYSDLNENKNNLMKLSTVEDGTWGAASGDELCYLFKCPRLEDKYLKHHRSMSEEKKIQRKLVKMWSNFAKYGNPTPKGDPILEDLIWPPYNTETKEYLHIDKKIEVKQDLLKDRFTFWRDFIRKWESKAVDGLISKRKINKKEEL